MILTTRSMFPSARALRDSMSTKHLITTDPQRCVGKTKIIRWGNAQSPTIGGVNPPELVALCSDKKDTSEFFELETPLYRLNTVLEFPFIARTTLTGYGGAGIIVVENESMIPRGNYYSTPFLKFASELRIHVLGGKSVKAFKKIRVGGLDEERYPIRNAHRGYDFSRIEVPDGARAFVDQIWDEIQGKLDIFDGFFAADLGWVSRTPDTPGHYVLIELNSAPGLTENADTCRLYAEYLDRVA